MHDKGISYEGDILDLGMEHKIVARTGAWFRYGDIQLGQGKEKSRDYLKANPHITQEIRDKIMATGDLEESKVSAAGPAHDSTDESAEDEDF
jgi:recombination protein RecA